MQPLRRSIAGLVIIVCATILLGANGDRSRFEELGRHRIICVCGCNQLLLECNHVGCQYSDRMRDQLMTAVQRDSSDDSVLQSFVQEYGTIVLAAPTAKGFDKIAWIMPFAVFFAGSLAAIAVIRVWREQQPAHGTYRASPVLEQYRQQARKETEL